MRAVLILASIILCTLLSCNEKDQPDPPPPAPNYYMSLKINGKEYKNVSFHVLSSASGYIRITVYEFYNATGFPYSFIIEKATNGRICAAVMPKGVYLPYISFADTCGYDIPATDTNGNPYNMQDVYYYDSGTLNYSKSGCKTQTIYDIFCPCPFQINVCDLNGTFSLIFKNKLNQRVEITEGEFFGKEIPQ